MSSQGALDWNYAFECQTYQTASSHFGARIFDEFELLHCIPRQINLITTSQQTHNLQQRAIGCPRVDLFSLSALPLSEVHLELVLSTFDDDAERAGPVAGPESPRQPTRTPRRRSCHCVDAQFYPSNIPTKAELPTSRCRSYSHSRDTALLGTSSKQSNKEASIQSSLRH